MSDQLKRNNFDQGQQIKKLRFDLASLQKITNENGPFLMDPEMKPVQKGYVAEYLFRYELLRRGLKFLVPPEQSEALDLVVIGPSGTFYRCEVKGHLSSEGASFKRTLRGKQNSSSKYTEENLDFLYWLI